MPDIATVLRDSFGFDGLRNGQEAVIERLIAGRSSLAVFPTGGGKSLCYQLPALMIDGLTVVVSPLIALMKDQIDFLKSRGIPAARLDSSLTLEEYREVWSQLRSGELKLLYIAPERFQNERFMARLKELHIGLLAIDEAHCISEWGHNFRPDYLKLARVAEELGVERVLALTATATPAVVEGICRAFSIAPDDYVHTGFHRPNLFLRMTPMAGNARAAHLIERLRAHEAGATIVYVTQQKTAEWLAGEVAKAGFSARAYHAGMETEQRTEVQEWFMGSPDAVVVATIAFGMGIDKSDIRFVYHYNLPKALENYAQEIGRAGRDGEPAVCELFASPEDALILQNFSYGDTPTPEAVHGLVSELMSLGETFDVSRYALSNKHDIRGLVVATLLAYLELEGVLASIAPFYDTYRFKPARSSAEILARFDPERSDFLRRVLSCSKKARTWFAIDLTESAERLGEPRDRLVRALEFLAEQGELELKVSGVRHGYRRVGAPPDVDELAAKLSARFAASEARDVARIVDVLALAAQPGCVTKSMLSYFGEELAAGCGHCDRCLGEPIAELPPTPEYTFSSDDQAVLEDLIHHGGPALASARQKARFLCGLPSPAAGKAKLRRHAEWGRLGRVPFSEVLGFVERS